MRVRREGLLVLLVTALAFVHPARGEAATSSAPASTTPAPDSTTDDADALYSLGKQLFDTYAPPEVKAEYEFPSREAWNAFFSRLQTALNSESLEELAQNAPEARAALQRLRAAGVEPDLADWLEQRLDEAEAARDATAPRPAPPPSPPTKAPPRRPGSTPVPRSAARLPYYDLWVTRVRNRPIPARADEVMPVLRQAFAAEGVPPALAWVAEAESSLNPSARSPAGAKGLFQLMPDTARTLGLGTFMPDERTNPEKSARAAARYLGQLHRRFGSWPLSLAAYNAGEGRVARALDARHASDFTAIADALPAETRMYVPKVCALVAVRTGTSVVDQ